MYKEVRDLSFYVNFANETQEDLRKFDSWIVAIEDKQKQLELRKKLVAIKEVFDGLVSSLKTKGYVSDFILADYRVKLNDMKRDFETTVAPLCFSNTNTR